MAAKVVFTGAATFTRLSLHCFYYRLVADTGKSWFKWCIHLNVIYTLGILISFTYVYTTFNSFKRNVHQLTFDRLIAIFLCTPVSDYWVIGSPADSCMDEGTVTLVCGIINCVADFATTITPIPLILGVSICLFYGCAMLTQCSSTCRAANATLSLASLLWVSSLLSQVSFAHGTSTSHWSRLTTTLGKPNILVGNLIDSS